MIPSGDYIYITEKNIMLAMLFEYSQHTEAWNPNKN
jgi:hypothetical protein